MFSQQTAFHRLRALGAATLLFTSIAACAETDTSGDDVPAQPDGQSPLPPVDASTGYDAGSNAPGRDAGALDAAVVRDAAISVDAARPVDAAQPTVDANMSIPDANMSRPDASSDAGDVIPPLPPDTKPEDWKLNSDSASECPVTPPVIPIIGGPCLGIYFGCGWTHPDGRMYSCTCDWVHWLCI